MFTGRLYKAVYANQNLNLAWNKVRQNKGAGGIDKMNIILFNKMLFERLLSLKDHLQRKTYQPRPIKHFNMKKPDGTRRPIGILTVEDRIVQRAVLQVIEPLFDRHFRPFSFGYRKGLSRGNAIETINRNFNRGFLWVIDADILEFFQNIDHGLLIKQVKKVVTDRDILKLLSKWLDMSGMGRVGILQGSPLSPLLANIYLDPLDKAILKKGFKMVRFGDDFIVQCKTEKETQLAMKYAQKILRKLKLELHPHKTQITHFDKGVRFLGYILKSYHGSNGKLLHRYPLKPIRKKEDTQHVRALPYNSRDHFENYGETLCCDTGQEKTLRSASHKN